MLCKPSSSAQTLHSNEESPKSGYPRPPAFSRPQKTQKQAKTCQQALHHTVIAGLPPMSRPHQGRPSHFRGAALALSLGRITLSAFVQILA